MSLRHGLAVALILASLAGCATWTRVDPGSRAESQAGGYSLELPLGWVRRTADTHDFFVTRDGPALNYILVMRQPHDRTLPNTRRPTRADMLPHEVAELYLAEWRGNEATANLVVLSNTPVLLDGKPAVRLHVRYRNERGLPIERVMVVCVDARGRLTLLFEAPAIVYFQRGLPAFDAMVASVRFR
ncbi:hypothetical protein [Thiobacillus sedimenti]|uniref:Lipoprotein n=1 Tax=Thiobacillus sedimenti TaxID=3110231 RepID=A0ABZ1CIP1_9PROT|nr:hypothetical protein [Thiobacillus sp. SCUT-2]WRS39272.1 hypothetical protein VA613_14890 [Thiobacillus sp. SCUT-2]